MKAIILAAGRGSRMMHLTDDSPKCLVKLNGKSLLSWQVESLYKAGISEIGIVTGYKRELLANIVSFEFNNPKWAETNMVSSLVCADSWLRNQPCIVSYSDIFYSSDAIKSLVNCPKELSITYDPNWELLWRRRFVDPLLDAESFRLNSKNYVTEIGKKPNSITDIQGQYMGLLKFTPNSWIEALRVRDTMGSEEQAKLHMTGLLQQIIEHKNISVYAVPYDGLWGEIDSESDLIDSQNNFHLT